MWANVLEHYGPNTKINKETKKSFKNKIKLIINNIKQYFII